jgi:hypothetical protein
MAWTSREVPVLHAGNMLLDASQRINNSTINERSVEWAELDYQLENGFEKSHDSSSITDRIAKAKKNKEHFLNSVEPYQKDSRLLMKHLIDKQSRINIEKAKLIDSYIEKMEAVDQGFTEVKKQGNEDVDEQIIETIVRSQANNGELARRLIELESQVDEMKRFVEEKKKEIRQGVKYTMGIQHSLDMKRESELKQGRAIERNLVRWAEMT